MIQDAFECGRVTDAALIHAFKKLRGMVMLYHHARAQAVHRLGDAHSTLLARSLTERLWHFAGMIDSARQSYAISTSCGGDEHVTVEGLITVRSGFGHGQTLIRFEAAMAAKPR